ncbi:hypothetical protein [Ferruginibacter sp.]
MPDEEIDKLIRDAAGQHHPPYDDTAWGKMEVLLDKHLPQKKDRKKPLIFLLLFLLVGSAVFFVIQNRGGNKSPVITAGSADNSKENTAGASNGPVNNNSNNNPATTNTDAVDKTMPGQQSTAAATQPSPSATGTGNNNLQPVQKDNSNNMAAVAGDKDVAYATSKARKHQQKGRVAIKIKKPGVATDSEEDKDNVINNDKQPLNNGGKTSVATKAPAATGADDVVDNNTGNNTNPVDDKNIKKDDVVATIVKDSADKTVAVKKETEKNVTEKNKTGDKAAEKKNDKKFGDKFAITLSAGADMSYVSLANAGKVKPVYGAGLSYAINKHFTVASGVYVSKKIYEAKPSQYKFDYAYPSSLVNIKADCNVMEVPVSVYYNFLQSGKHNWLAGIGLSSFFMKKEDYEYQYVYAGGQTYSYYHSVDNENKHYFSVLTLSAGYQYKLNNFISITAEPYLKLPLGGVGAGKIKLNSTGLLFTASVRPFAKRK